MGTSYKAFGEDVVAPVNEEDTTLLGKEDLNKFDGTLITISGLILIPIMVSNPYLVLGGILGLLEMDNKGVF